MLVECDAREPSQAGQVQVQRALQQAIDAQRATGVMCCLPHQMGRQ
jgi:hypothetical protein